jgi:hypothetical protein
MKQRRVAMPQLNVTKLSVQGLKMLVTAIGRHGATQGFIEAEQEWERPPAPARRQRPAPPQHIVRHGTPESHVHQIKQPQLSTTAETLQELRRRLAKELYRLEMDLQGGGRIGKGVCDCLSKKHHLGIEATAEELMSYDKSPVYGQVIQWMNERLPVFEPAEIANHPPAFYQAMTPEVRAFRKQVMGTEDLMSILSAGAQRKVMKKKAEMEAHGSGDSGDDSDGG